MTLSTDLHGAGQPIDPMLVKAIETAFLAFSVPAVTFVPVPRKWRASNPRGAASGPKTPRKTNIKLELIERDGFRCAYCSRAFVDLNDATLDHVIPNCVVGHWQLWNLVLSCEPCNNAKADKVPLVLMPMLHSLLAGLMPTAPAVRRLNTAIAKRQDAEAAQRCKDKQLRKMRRLAWERRWRITKHLESLSGAPVRLAIEAAPTGEQGGQR